MKCETVQIRPHSLAELPLHCFTHCLICCFSRWVRFLPHWFTAFLYVDQQILCGGACYRRRLHSYCIRVMHTYACSCVGWNFSSSCCSIHAAIMGRLPCTTWHEPGVPKSSFFLWLLLLVVGLCDLPEQPRNICNPGSLRWLISICFSIVYCGSGKITTCTPNHCWAEAETRRKLCKDHQIRPRSCL